MSDRDALLRAAKDAAYAGEIGVDEDRVRAAPEPRPELVCLCGSTRFYDDFQQANYDLTMAGRIVLSVGFYPHAKAEHGHGEGVGHASAQKVALDELHKRKIDLADRVYVLNREGYIGASTRSEIEYAEAHQTPVVYAFDRDGVRSMIDGWPCFDHDATLAMVGHHQCAALSPDAVQSRAALRAAPVPPREPLTCGDPTHEHYWVGKPPTPAETGLREALEAFEAHTESCACKNETRTALIEAARTALSK